MNPAQTHTASWMVASWTSEGSETVQMWWASLLLSGSSGGKKYLRTSSTILKGRKEKMCLPLELLLRGRNQEAELRQFRPKGRL